MKIIETKLHGYIHYSLGFLFLWVPKIFHLKGDSPESIIFYILAVLILFLSLLADYELGIYKVLPLKSHLMLDVLLGLFLLVSPWLFGFWHRSFVPHMLFGIIMAAIGLLTLTQSRAAR